MVEGSLATATNASPMPTGRAPTPILRKVPAEVPTRWPPSEVCARAGPADTRAIAKARGTSLEVIVESHAPLRARQVVRRVLERAHDQRLACRFARELGQLFGREDALPLLE